MNDDNPVESSRSFTLEQHIIADLPPFSKPEQPKTNQIQEGLKTENLKHNPWSNFTFAASPKIQVWPKRNSSPLKNQPIPSFFNIWTEPSDVLSMKGHIKFRNISAENISETIVIDTAKKYENDPLLLINIFALVIYLSKSSFKNPHERIQMITKECDCRLKELLSQRKPIINYFNHNQAMKLAEAIMVYYFSDGKTYYNSDLVELSYLMAKCSGIAYYSKFCDFSDNLIRKYNMTAEELIEQHHIDEEMSHFRNEYEAFFSQ